LSIFASIKGLNIHYYPSQPRENRIFIGAKIIRKMVSKTGKSRKEDRGNPKE
jgi:hypothetical protein